MNSPYLTSVFAEAKDFGRIKDFKQYKKEVQKAVKNSFKALKADLADGDKDRGIKFSHFSLMKQLQFKLNHEAPQDLNIVIRNGINGIYQVVYRSGERTFYTDIYIPPQKLNLMSVEAVEKKVNDYCRDTELQDYYSQDDIKVNTKVRLDRPLPVVQESVKLCPKCNLGEEDCKCMLEGKIPYVKSIFKEESAEVDNKSDEHKDESHDDAVKRHLDDIRAGRPWKNKQTEAKKSAKDIGEGFYIHKTGMDSNGNHSVWVSKGSNKAKKIQTNGNCDACHGKSVEDILKSDKAKSEIKAYFKKHLMKENYDKTKLKQDVSMMSDKELDTYLDDHGWNEGDLNQMSRKEKEEICIDFILEDPDESRIYFGESQKPYLESIFGK